MPNRLRAGEAHTKHACAADKISVTATQMCWTDLAATLGAQAHKGAELAGFGVTRDLMEVAAEQNGCSGQPRNYRCWCH